MHAIPSSSDQIILVLSLIDGVGPVTVNRIVPYVQSASWQELLSFLPSDWVVRCGLSDRVARLVVAGLRDLSSFEKELQLIERHGVRWVTVTSPDYPELLKAIEVPPPVIYYQGQLQAAEKNTLAVVGSRAADAYGKLVIDQLVPELVSYGWTIVSGGARGADSMAHTATLQQQGITWAVLGSGLCHPYPRENANLFDQIVAAGGAVVSALPMNARPAPGNFPIRNRIIAGMSRGCIVVQAGRRSGASITARHALEQGREVFAVPGPFDSSLSVGCHALIQEGAKLVCHIDDILVEFGLIDTTKAFSCSIDTVQLSASAGPEGKLICLCRSAKTLPELMEGLDLPLSQLQALLFDLQLAGRVRQDISGRWISAV